MDRQPSKLEALADPGCYNLTFALGTVPGHPNGAGHAYIAQRLIATSNEPNSPRA